MGFRYLRAKKGSKFLSIITGISIGGVAIGVLTMIVTLSVMSGFEGELRKRLFSADTHILVERKDGSFRADETLLTQLQLGLPKGSAIFPVLQTEAILRSGKKVAGAIVKGVGQEQFDWIKGHVKEWAAKELLENAGGARMLLGQEMAYDLGVIPGDLVTIVSPIETEGPLGVVPRVKRFVVEGVYRTGVPEQELHVVFAAIRDVESFIREADIVNRVELRVGSFDEAPQVARGLQGKLGGEFLVRSWQELNAHLFHSLGLERTAMFVILIFIVIVASFNIVSTLTMMVIEKKRSLSILRAMGATRKQIGSIFLWEGLAIGLVGVTVGGALALAICGALSKYPIIQLPEFYYDRSLPVVVEPLAVGGIIAAALLVVACAAFLPARKASDLSPMQGIRGDN